LLGLFEYCPPAPPPPPAFIPLGGATDKLLALR
jgi:hypothetical protein